MKNYYFILEVSIYASASEIKRSYRKLALQYHPDKNASPQAESIFKEINEAYEVLSDPAQKQAYDQLLRGGGPVVEVPEEERTYHRDPRYRPKQPGTVRPSHRQEIFAMMAQNLNRAILISRISLAFVVVLIIDFSLPATIEETKVLGGDQTSSSSLRLELTSGKSVSVSMDEAKKLFKRDPYSLHKSTLFHVPFSLENMRTHQRIPVELSIYGNFIFWPIILLLTSIAGSFYWKGVEFRFNVAIVNVILVILTIVFLQVHKM